MYFLFAKHGEHVLKCTLFINKQNLFSFFFLCLISLLHSLCLSHSSVLLIAFCGTIYLSICIYLSLSLSLSPASSSPVLECLTPWAADSPSPRMQFSQQNAKTFHSGSELGPVWGERGGGLHRVFCFLQGLR